MDTRRRPVHEPTLPAADRGAHDGRLPAAAQLRLCGLQYVERDAECNSIVYIGDGPNPRNISNAHKDPTHLLSAFLKTLRSSRVDALTFSGLTFTSAIAKLVIEAPITAHQLSFLSGSCTELTSTELRDVVLHVSPTSLCLYSCHLRACQLTDEFLCSLRKNNVRRALFQNVVPVDGESFCVTDDAVVGFRMQQDVCVGEEEDAPKQGPLGELVLHNGSFTKDLFKRLVEANTSSTRTQPLRIFVSPCSVVEEDLRDFAQHLSYRHRGMPYETRIYDFTDEQQNAPKHLQIVLHAENNELEMICAQRPDPLFYKSDE